MGSNPTLSVPTSCAPGCNSLVMHDLPLALARRRTGKDIVNRPLSSCPNHCHPVTVDALHAPGADAAAFHRWTQHEVSLARRARDRGRRIGNHAVDGGHVGGNETLGGYVSPFVASSIVATLIV